jgi:hypothetical protein
MRELRDLIATREGQQFLQDHGATQFGTNSSKLICSGQQTYIDYGHSVLDKITLLRAMESQADLHPFFLWVDTDRSASDTLMTKFAWPVFGKKGPITILPPEAGEIEMRFAEVDEDVLVSAIDRLGSYLRDLAGQGTAGHEDARARYKQLRQIFTSAGDDTLSSFNLRVTEHLLQAVYGYTPPSVVLSDVLDTAFVIKGLNVLLNHIDAYIEAFNAGVNALLANDVNPHVHHVDTDYLPLFYSCDVDGRRLRLHHRIEGSGEHFAVSECRCGERYKFYLGKGELRADEIVATRRWSLDVCFPILFNDQISGFVAGKSSALYLLVMNHALRTVLKQQQVPIFVSLSHNSHPAQDSLVHRYFIGHDT